MDWVTYCSRGMDCIKKYRYIILIIIAGILLLQIPETESSEQSPIQPEAETSSTPSLEDSLAQILSMIEGAGRVEVLLTQSKGEEILYQTDVDQSSRENSQEIRKDTVLISDDDRSETGLIRQRNPPIYRGAIILCQGADKAGIRLSIVEAVMGVTGLTSDKITVLKMK